MPQPTIESVKDFKQEFDERYDRTQQLGVLLESKTRLKEVVVVDSKNREEFMNFVTSLIAFTQSEERKRCVEIVEKAPTQGYYRDYAHKETIIKAINSNE